MKSILVDRDIMNFNIAFEEPEAVTFLETVLDYYKQNVYSGFEKTVRGMLDIRCDGVPTLVIKDYVAFFDNLRMYYEKTIDFYVASTTFSALQTSELTNCLKYIWLRATPEDFMEPERFLARQIEMAWPVTRPSQNTTKSSRSESCPFLKTTLSPSKTK